MFSALKHHSAFSWYGALVSQLGMSRVMAVAWMRAATSVLRTTPALTTQQVFTCVGHLASAIGSSRREGHRGGDGVAPARLETPARCHRAEGEATWGLLV